MGERFAGMNSMLTECPGRINQERDRECAIAPGSDYVVPFGQRPEHLLCAVSGVCVGQSRWHCPFQVKDRYIIVQEQGNATVG
jgi:hypothetical protein